MGTKRRRSTQTLVWGKKEGHTSAPTCQWRIGPANVISSRLWAESRCFKMPAAVSQITLESSSCLPSSLLWSKVTGSNFFPPLINFYLVKGKKISTDRWSLELRLHKEASTDSLVDFSLCSKSLTHLELRDCLVLWLTSWLASGGLGFMSDTAQLLVRRMRLF